MQIEKHWTDKTREDMTERDWRIFREDHNISYKGSLDKSCLPIRSWDEAHLPDPLLQARVLAPVPLFLCCCVFVLLLLCSLSRPSARWGIASSLHELCAFEHIRSVRGSLRDAPRLPIMLVVGALTPSLCCAQAIDAMGYVKPSAIQMAAIPLGLKYRDVIGIAETGSGKTAAFVLPMLVYIKGQLGSAPKLSAKVYLGRHTLLVPASSQIELNLTRPCHRSHVTMQDYPRSNRCNDYHLHSPTLPDGLNCVTLADRDWLMRRVQRTGPSPSSWRRLASWRSRLRRKRSRWPSLRSTASSASSEVSTQNVDAPHYCRKPS